MILELISAAVGTVAFALLYGVPRRCYPYCAFIGACGWGMFKLMLNLGLGMGFSIFFGAVAIALVARFMAVYSHCPSTVFVTTGIFTLVPGVAIYWTAYYLVTSQLGDALSNGLLALKVMLAIVLGIIFVFEIPHSFFRVMDRKKQ